MKRPAIAASIVAVGVVLWFTAGEETKPRAIDGDDVRVPAAATSRAQSALRTSGCLVKGTLSGGLGRSVRVYSIAAGADIDADLAGASFSAEVPSPGAVVITAVAEDGRTATAEVSCAGYVDVALAFAPARVRFAVIDGRCVYLETGAPVARARVIASSWSTIADDAGKFLVHAPVGEHEIRCALDGDESEPVEVDVISGEKRTIEVRMPASTIVLGRVIDERGAPVEGAQVSARARVRVERGAVTDASGSFELRGLAPGSVIIDAQSEGLFAEQQVVARLGIPYASVELVLRSGTYSVFGQVLDDQEVPIEGALVRVDGPLSREVRTDAGGSFTIAGLAHDAVTLSAEAEGFMPWDRVIQPEAFGEMISVKLERGCTAKVRVMPAEPKLAVAVRVGNVEATGETGELLELKGVRGEQLVVAESIGNVVRRASKQGALCGDAPIELLLEASEEQGTIEVEVERQDGTPVEGAEVLIAPIRLSARTDQLGIARFEGLKPGRYAVINNYEREWADVDPNEITRVKLVIHDEEGTVNGYVSSHNEPVEGAAIRATCGSSGYPRSLDGAEIVARTNAAGAFEFDPEQGSVCTVRAEHADEGASDAVVLRAGGLPAELEINRMASISGVVLTREDGAPVSSYQLTVRPIGRASDVDARSLFIRDASGRFQLGGLPPGLLSISVRSDRGRAHIEVSVPRGESIDNIELRVFDRGSVRGRVLGPDGEAVARAMVHVRRVREGGVETSGVTDAEGRFLLMGGGGDALRVTISHPGYYPYGTQPFDFDGLSARKELGDIVLSLRSSRDEKEGGIGIQFAGDPHGVRVVDFVRESPARDAGLEIGDVITAIDGTPAGRLPMVSWLVALRGPVGTPVVLEIERGTLPRFSVSVIRRAIGLPALPVEAEP